MKSHENNIIPRPPVIVVMGHIDHGKSTLLDYIRETNIVEKEAGGITQHISAYEVVHNDKEGNERKITFLDTPGHEAFQKMRNHGAEVADIAILIVSAEEGIKTQTLEALDAIKRADIPFIVAINKIDKTNANVEKVKQELSEKGIYLEGLGGEVPFVPISSKAGTGIPELLEMMLLVADLAELKGDANAPAEGVIIEAHRDPKKGVSATLIIKNGTLKSGMCISSGSNVSPVRIFESFLGKSIKEARFSSPVRIVGWNEIPSVGATFNGYENKKKAEQAASEPSAQTANDKTEEPAEGTDGKTIIPVILKADVAGTIDAIEHEISKLQTDELEIRIVSCGVGAISETDIKTALGNSNTLIVGFNTAVDNIASELADRNGIEIQTFEIIYKLSEWLAEIAEKRRPRKEIEEVKGRAKILKTFSKTKQKQVLGARMEEGALAQGNAVRIMRSDTDIGRGAIGSIQQNRVDTKQIESGEFGVEVKAAIDIAPGDFLETVVVTIK